MNIKSNQIINWICFIIFGLLFCFSAQAQFGRQQDIAGDNRSQANVQSINDGMCERIKNSKYFAEYAAFAKSTYESPPQVNNFPFDTEDKIVTKWLIKKVRAIEKEYQALHNAQPTYENWNKFAVLQSQWYKQINECAAVLAPTNLMTLFVSGYHEYEDLRRIIKNNPPKTNTVRDVDDSGNIVVKQVKTSYEIPIINIFIDRQNFIPYERAIPGLIAILDKDNKFMSTIYPELKKEWVSVFTQIEKEKKEFAELTQKEEKEKEEKAIALQRQKEIALKNQTENIERMRKIQKGDFKFASSCEDIIKALGDKIDYNDGASIKPHQGLKATAGKLDRFSGDNGIILLQSRSGITGAEFKTSSSTHWINRNDIRINSGVLVIGKYTSNTSIKLANGSSIQSPFLEIICIQPYLY